MSSNLDPADYPGSRACSTCGSLMKENRRHLHELNEGDEVRLVDDTPDSYELVKQGAMFCNVNPMQGRKKTLRWAPTTEVIPVHE